jgi:hypothetical protein
MFEPARAAIILIGTLAVLPVAAMAQTAAGPVKKSAARPYSPPRTPWGEPDLQGVYSNRTITPFERPANLAGKEVLTDEEVAALERAAAANSADRREGGAEADVSRAYNEFWWDRGKKVTTRRSSLVVDPPDGRVPPLTAEAQRRAQDEWKQPAFRSAGAAGARGADSYVDRSLFERCITRGLPGAMSPSAYNNNYQIVQGPGYVAIVIEMLGGVRIIPTDGRRHSGSNFRQLMGDSVGHWDGDTLVVDTTNFTNKALYRGSAETLHLIERFTRVEPNLIDYRFTVDDPATFTRSWTVAIPYLNIGEPLYEYACHEGNYGMEGILSGARADEKAAAEAVHGRRSE